MRLPTTLAELEAFLAVAELRSFSRAAERLCVTQPAVTGRVARLEKALGYRLIDRSTRDLRLTADGERARLVCERALGEVRLLFEGARQQRGRSGESVRVACTGGVGALYMPSVVRAFNQEHPEIAIRLADRSPTAAIEAVRAGRADLGVMAPGPAPPDIAFIPLVDDECAVIAPAGHPLAAKPSATLAEILSHQILMADDQLPLRRTVQALADARGLTFTRAPESRHVGSILNMFGMVAAGYGVMIQPRGLSRLGVDLPLRAIPISDARIGHVYGLVTRAGVAGHRAAELFKASLIRSIRAEPPSL